MRLSQHAAVSAVVGAAVWALTRSPEIAVSSFLTGFLVDVDHLADYWREYPGSLDVRHFFRTCHEFRLRRLVLPLHSLELLPAAAAAAVLTRSPLAVGFCIGLAQHLAFDHLFNPVRPFGYSLLHRAFNGFRADSVFVVPECYRTPDSR